jgi:thiamine-phosphate diphosphorylase
VRIPRLHVVTDATVLRRTRFLSEAVSLLAEGGEDVALHLRGSGLPGRSLLDLALPCADAAARSGGRLVINDRLDVALAVSAWGVQLGQASFGIADARAILPAATVIGASVHGPDELRSAILDGAEFLLAGTLYRSTSHPEREGSGTAWLSSSAGSERPVIGIGGITLARVADVLRAGAHGVAVISGVWDADSPVDALAEYLKLLG